MGTLSVYDVAPELDDRVVLSRDEEGRIFDFVSMTCVDVKVWGTHEIKTINLRAFVWDGATWRRG
jgi:hypothetical protein